MPSRFPRPTSMSPTHGLCVMADCPRKRQTKITLVMGGRVRMVEVCQWHADRAAPPVKLASAGG